MRWSTGMLLLATAACATDAGPDQTMRASAPLLPTSRDSAGVTIYEHPADALVRMPTITLDSTPLAVIGGEALEDDVTSLRVQAVLADGRVLGWDASDGAVKLFGADGARLASYGRKGEGPGEFRTIDVLAVGPGDTIFASDWITSRTTILTPDGGIIGSESTPLRGVRQQFMVVGTLTDGRWLLTPTMVRLAFRSASSEPDTSRPITPALGYQPGQGESGIDTLVVQVGDPLVQFSMSHNGTSELGEGPERFGRFPIVTPWAGGVAAVSNRDRSIDRYDAAGVLRSIVRVSAPLQEITDSLKEAVIKKSMAGLRERLADAPPSQPVDLDEQEQNLRSMAWAPVLPPFGQAIVTNGSLLWLEEARLDYTAPATLVAVDTNGQLMGRLQVPDGDRLVAIGTDRLVVRHENDDGIITFRVIQFHLPG